MRIVRVIDYFQPILGYKEYFSSRALVKEGHEVHIVTSDRYRPFPNYEDSVGRLLGPRHVGSGTGEVDGLVVHRQPVAVEYGYRVWMRRFERTLRGLDPDVVLMNGIANATTLRTCVLKLRHESFKLAIEDHMVPGISRHVFHRQFNAAFRQLAKPLVARAADALIAVSGPTKEFMVDTYGFPAERVAVVPLGVDGDLFRPDPVARRETRRTLGLGDDDVLIVHAGKLIEEKDPALLVAAATDLLARHGRARLLLIGGGPPDYVNRIRATARDAGVADRVLWQPAVENRELPRWYAAADVAVWPARSSLTMVEAQACGLPIVVSSFPAAAERASDGRGVVFPSGDRAQLQQALEGLIMDADRRQRIGERARAWVMANLEYRILARRTLELVGCPA